MPVPKASHKGRTIFHASRDSGPRRREQGAAFIEARKASGQPARITESETRREANDAACFWRSQGDSNPCFRRERATSWTARRWEPAVADKPVAGVKSNHQRQAFRPASTNSPLVFRGGGVPASSGPSQRKRRLWRRKTRSHVVAIRIYFEINQNDVDGVTDWQAIAAILSVQSVPRGRRLRIG